MHIYIKRNKWVKVRFRTVDLATEQIFAFKKKTYYTIAEAIQASLS